MSDPTTAQVKRVYVLAPDNLARDGKPDWSMVADGQFDRWLAGVQREAAATALDDFVPALEDTESLDAAVTLAHSRAAEYREGKR